MHFTDGKLQNWNVDDLRKNLLQRDIQIGNNARQANLIQKVNSAQKLDLPIQHSQEKREKLILIAKYNKLSIDDVQIRHPNDVKENYIIRSEYKVLFWIILINMQNWILQRKL